MSLTLEVGISAHTPHNTHQHRSSGVQRAKRERKGGRERRKEREDTSGIQVWEQQNHRGSIRKAFSLAQPSLCCSVTWFWQRFHPGSPPLSLCSGRASTQTRVGACRGGAGGSRAGGRASCGGKGREGWNGRDGRDGKDGRDGRGELDRLPARCHGDAAAQPMGGRGGAGCAVLGRHLVGAAGRGTGTSGARPRDGPAHRPGRPRQQGRNPGSPPWAQAEASPVPPSPSGSQADVSPQRLYATPCRSGAEESGSAFVSSTRDNPREPEIPSFKALLPRRNLPAC